MTLQHSFDMICQPLTKKGDWQTGTLKLAGDRKARLVIANTGGGYSTALRVYDEMGKVLENPILTFDVLRGKLGGVRVDTEDNDTLYLFHAAYAHHNDDALEVPERSTQQEIDTLANIIDGAYGGQNE